MDRERGRGRTTVPSGGGRPSSALDVQPPLSASRKERTGQLHGMWEFASVLTFLDTFESALKLKSATYTPWVSLPSFSFSSPTIFPLPPLELLLQSAINIF